MKWRHTVRLAFAVLLLTASGKASAQSNDPFALQRLVGQLYQEHKYQEAAEIAARYVVVAKARYGEADREYAVALRWQAHIYKALDRYAEAEPLFKQTIDILERKFGADHRDVGATLNDLAGLYAIQGRYMEAEVLQKRTIAIAEKLFGAEHQNLAAVLNNLAENYKAQGRYSEAEALYNRALAIGEKTLGPDNPDLAVGLNNLGALYDDQARYAEAESLYQRALAIRERRLGPDHPQVGISLNNLGQIYSTEERYAEAEPLLKRSLAIAEKAFGPEHRSVATRLNNLSELYRKQRHFADAQPLSERSLRIAEKALGADHPSVATSLNNLALLFRDQGKYSDAEPLYKRAIAIVEKAYGARHPDVGNHLSNLAGLYATQGRYADALSIYARALSIKEKALGSDHPDVGITVASMAVAFAEKGDFASALSYQRRATALRIKLGRAAREEGGKRQLDQGSNYFRYHVMLADRIGSDKAALFSETFELAQWALQSEASQAVAQMSARFASSKGALSQAVRERQDLLNQRQAANRRLLSAAANADVVGTDAARKMIAPLDARLSALEDRLAREFPEYEQLARPKPLSLEEVRRVLKDDEALIAFLDVRYSGKLDEEAFAWIVTKADARWTKLSSTPTQIIEAVAALRCGLDQAAWEGEGGSRCGRFITGGYSAVDASAGKPLPFDFARAHDLYRALFGPFGDLIRDKHLLVVPSGPLTALPFQVLITMAPARIALADVAPFKEAAWLAKQHAITVLPSIASLKALREFAKESKAVQPFIGFGNPVLLGPDGADKRAWQRQSCEVASSPAQIASRGVRSAIPKFFRSGLADVVEVRAQYPLPETADELCGVARSSGASETAVYLGKNASETMIKALSANGSLATARVVHFATHGLLAGETELFAANRAEPALIMTPPPKASEEDDGLLTASEIAQLRLDADWVVLSACNTAGGGTDKPGTEALSGLARAFFYAGARALLVSHWAVNSHATVELITKTFEELKANPKLGRAEALRRSMMALADKGGEDAHPANWGPFVVVGEGAH